MWNFAQRLTCSLDSFYFHSIAAANILFIYWKFLFRSLKLKLSNNATLDLYQ